MFIQKLHPFAQKLHNFLQETDFKKFTVQP